MQNGDENSEMSREMEIVSRFFKPPKQHFFLFGPRGTGKSVWMTRVFPDAVRVDLLAPETFRVLSSRPERLQELIGGKPVRGAVLIDEIQKLPTLLDLVHKLIEERRGHQFILTGSSSRKLKRSGVDLLAGRALNLSLHPFMAAELADRFDFDRALEHGLLPLVYQAEEPSAVLEAYVSLYLKEEVQAEALTRNIGDFARFLEVISFSQACSLNITNVADECQVDRKRVESYIVILEDLLLAARVPVFTRRARRQTAAHPKFYFFDCGVFRALRPKGPFDRAEEVGGAALEGVVMQHVRAWNAYRGTPNEIYYWRTRSGVEVDIVVYGVDGLWAIEVKNSNQVHPADLRGLCTFKQDYPEAQCLLLYRGGERLKKDDVLCVPCDQFLRQLHPNCERLCVP